MNDAAIPSHETIDAMGSLDRINFVNSTRSRILAGETLPEALLDICVYAMQKSRSAPKAAAKAEKKGAVPSMSVTDL